MKEEMNQDVNDFIDFDEDSQDSQCTYSLYVRLQENIYLHLKICILESPTSSFQVQSNDVRCFQAVEKISPYFSNTEKLFPPL